MPVTSCSLKPATTKRQQAHSRQAKRGKPQAGVPARPVDIAVAAPAAPADPAPGVAAEDAKQSWLVWLIFGVLFFFLWRGIDLSLTYHLGFNVCKAAGLLGSPSFYLEMDFAREMIARPGGLAHYLSALLSQSFFLPWLGALAMTCLAAMVSLLLKDSLPRLRLGRCGVPAFLPAVLLLGLYGNYVSYCSPMVSVVIGLLAGWVHLRWCARAGWLRLPVLAGLAVGVYLLGASALLVFAPIVLFAEIRRGWRPPLLLAILAAAAVTPPLVGFVCFGLRPAESYMLALPAGTHPTDLRSVANRMSYLGLKDTGIRQAGMLGAFYVAVAFCGPVCLAIEKLRTLAPMRLARIRSARLRATAQLIALSLAVTGVFWWTHERPTQALLAVENFASAGMWPELLQAAKGFETNEYIACAAAQAAYHTGRLRTELPVLKSPDNLLMLNYDSPAAWRKSDVYYDLGFVNMAMHEAVEAMETWGQRPALLKRLATLNLAVGNHQSAAIYLNRLARIPFQGQWARQYLARMKSDPTLASDPEILRLRRSMPVEDVQVWYTRPDRRMALLLQADPTNRMAFEYLMTYYLLTRDLPAFARQLSRLKDFPGLELSPLWQEALVMAANGTDLRPEESKAIAATTLRFGEVLRIVKECGYDQKLAGPRLEREYGHTYFYYYFCRN